MLCYFRPQIKKVEDRTHISVVENVGKNDSVTSTSSLVGLVLRNGDRTSSIILLSNDGNRFAPKNSGVRAVDASMFQLQAWSAGKHNKDRTHRTVNSALGLSLHSQVNTFSDFATVIKLKILKKKT